MNRATEHAAQRDSKGEVELIESIAKGSEACLNELISRYASQVTGICRQICPDETEIHSLVSEVFWEAWRRAASYDSRRSSVRTFLLMIARSRAIDWRRAASARQRALKRYATLSSDNEVLHIDSTHPSAASLRQETESDLKTAISSLPEVQGEAIELAFWKGYTHEEIARQLDTPLGTVKTRIRSGLRQLKQILSCEYSTKEVS